MSKRVVRVIAVAAVVASVAAFGSGLLPDPGPAVHIDEHGAIGVTTAAAAHPAWVNRSAVRRLDVSDRQKVVDVGVEGVGAPGGD